MRAHTILWIGLLLLPQCTMAQEDATRQFGCFSKDLWTQFDPLPSLKFIEFSSADEIQRWKARPAVTFEGFDAKKYGFSRTEFYRTHIPVPGREGLDQSPQEDSTDRLAFAIRITTPHGDRWFELANPDDPSQETLYIQAFDDQASAPEESDHSRVNSGSQGDEMAKWLAITPATPEAKLPLFKLSYEHRDSGLYHVQTFQQQLLLDLRSGIPRIVKTVSCEEYESIGGACSGVDGAWAPSDHLECRWDSVSSDFRCTMSIPFGRSGAQREFLLLSGQPIEPAIPLPQVAQLAVEIQKNPKTATETVLVAGLGPTRLVQRFPDLLPDDDVFVFASPGAGSELNARLTQVRVPPTGKPVVETIPTWALGGEAVEEKDAPSGYTPSASTLTHSSRIIEQRRGFRAFNLVLNESAGTNAMHVVYWIGLDAADEKLVANAVRLASEDYVYGGCGREFHEGTATQIQQKAGFAEATVRVQGQFNSEYDNPYPSDEGNCIWSGLLHWKNGTGFRVRKLAEDCRAAHREITIRDDGSIQTGSLH